MPRSDDLLLMAAATAAVAAITNVVHLGMAMLEDDLQEEAMLGLLGDSSEEEQEEEEEEEGSRPKRMRRTFPRPNYWGSTWGQWLKKLEELSDAEGGLDPKCSEAVRFEEAFGVPYEVYLLVMDSASFVFSTATHDVAGRDCPPPDLKVLGVLKMLAGGTTFTNVKASTLMSHSTAETSFHLFCKKFTGMMWDAWVKLPQGEDLKKAGDVYRKCGYPGAMGSVSRTRFRWDGCPSSEQDAHTGKGGDHPTVVVEAICDHSGRIIAATKSHPGGAENIVARDKSVWRIQNEEPWKSHGYNLYNADGTEAAHQGAWLVADKGYPEIPPLIPPIRACKTSEQRHWSKRLQSMSRKDVRRCFDGVKKKFGMFDGGITFNTREKIDNAWFTACILHNMLHNHRKLDVMQEGEEEEEEEEEEGEGGGEGGEGGEEGKGESGEEKVADRVGSAGALRETTSDDGVGEKAEGGAEVGAGGEEPLPGFQQLRSKLVTHYTYARDKKQVLWFKGAEV